MDSISWTLEIPPGGGFVKDYFGLSPILEDRSGLGVTELPGYLEFMTRGVTEKKFEAKHGQRAYHTPTRVF